MEILSFVISATTVLGLIVFFIMFVITENKKIKKREIEFSILKEQLEICNNIQKHSLAFDDKFTESNANLKEQLEILGNNIQKCYLDFDDKFTESHTNFFQYCKKFEKSLNEYSVEIRTQEIGLQAEMQV
ncbi:MAG: hypothetical protein Ta2F_12590 [Termitinemataceae bacterium]|nr:MAG: hypothetical protein Ta2F_12590 [Termitinemataceae bacterium]